VKSKASQPKRFLTSFRLQWKTVQFEQARSNGLGRLLADTKVDNSSPQQAWQSRPDVSELKELSLINGAHPIPPLLQGQSHALLSQLSKLCLLRQTKKHDTKVVALGKRSLPIGKV
jgi:hypothetical protein